MTRGVLARRNLVGSAFPGAPAAYDGTLIGRTDARDSLGESLGACPRVQSREHYISKGLFEGDSVKLKGLPWCKFEEITIGLASASTKIVQDAQRAAFNAR